MFTSSPFRGRRSLLRWILSGGEKVANFCVTRYLSGPKRTAFATSLPLFSAPFVQFTEEQVSQKPDIDEDLPDDFDVHSHACDFIRMKGYSLVA